MAPQVFLPCPGSGLLRGLGQVLGLVGLAELSLSPAVFVFRDCDCTRFGISLLAGFVKALGGGERIRRGGGGRDGGREVPGAGAGAGGMALLSAGPETVFSGERERLQNGRPNSSGR